MSIAMVSPDSQADSAVAVFITDGMGFSGKLVKSLCDDFGVTLAGIQDQWKDKIVDIAYLNYVETFDIITAIEALEMLLKNLALRFSLAKMWLLLRKYY